MKKWANGWVFYWSNIWNKNTKSWTDQIFCKGQLDVMVSFQLQLSPLVWGLLVNLRNRFKFCEKYEWAAPELGWKWNVLRWRLPRPQNPFVVRTRQGLRASPLLLCQWWWWWWWWLCLLCWYLSFAQLFFYSCYMLSVEIILNKEACFM